MIPEEQQEQPVYRARKRYLLFPWLGLVALWTINASRLEEAVARILPFRVRVPWSAGLGPGMLLLLVICSALWSHGFLRGRGTRGIELRVKMVLMTLLVTFCQICLAASVFYAGCVILLSSHR